MSIPNDNNVTSARIVIQNWSQKTLTVTDLSRTLLQHFQDHRLDWMHACGAKGRCTTCKVMVLEGLEQMQPLTPAEQRYRQLGALHNQERLSCQARISGDVTLRIPEEYKLPHIDYSVR
jgi:2Fe-2S ferredoxin